jgi:WS/DGAT/MGAT family acyltransferase
VDLVKLLFDVERDPDQAEPPDWTPAGQVSDTELATRALRDWATAPIGLAREAAGAARKPFETVEKLQQIGEGTGEMLKNLASSAPESPLNCEIGPNRRVIWIDAELADAKKVKNELGGTVNDVFLAVISGALNRWLRGRGVATEGLQVRGAVPVSVLDSDERDELGNNIALMVAHLPTDVEDPVERLRIVRDQMERLKSSKQAVSAQAIGRLENLAPPNLFSGLHFSTRLYNLLVSNTPGPQFPLYLMGREMEEMVPIAFLAPNQALGVAFFSYNGTVSISLIGDHDAMPDLDGLAEAVKASIAELLEAARNPAGVAEPQATL